MQPRSIPKLELSATSPLASLLRFRRSAPEFAKGSRFHRLLDPFRLRESVISHVSGRHCRVNGRPVVHFGSSDYLGLEQHPEVLYAAKRALEELGAGASCARMISVESNLSELEESLAQLLRFESCLVGHNGAQVHGDAIPLLFGDESCTLFVDRHADPAIHLAARAAAGLGARVVRVDVSDPPALQRILAKEKPRRGALLLDGVYRNHGHSPDLALLDEACRGANLILYVDDTHGVGALGAGGGGSAEVFGLRRDNLILVGGLQAAFGAYGAFLAGPSALADFLRVTATSFLTAGSLPPSAVEAALAAVRIARSPEGRQLRQRLADSSRLLRARLQALGFIVPPGEGPLFAVTIGRDLKTLMAARKLFDLGFLVPCVAFPELPKGRGVLRVSLTALHSAEDLDALVEAFRELRHYLPKHENPLRQAAHLAFQVARAKWQGSRYAGL